MKLFFEKTFLLSVLVTAIFSCASGFGPYAQMILTTNELKGIDLIGTTQRSQGNVKNVQTIISVLNSDSVIIAAMKKSAMDREFSDVKLQLRTSINKYECVNVQFYSKDKEMSCKFLNALYSEMNDYFNRKDQQNAIDSLKILEGELELLTAKEDSISNLLDKEDYEGYKENVKQMYKQLAQGKKPNKKISAPSIQGKLEQLIVFRKQHVDLKRKKNEMELEAHMTGPSAFFVSAPHYVSR